MLSISEDFLICDLAETYNVYITDWEHTPYPISYIAILASGLSDDSRIKREMGSHKLTLTEGLLATLIDKVNILVWQKTKDGVKGRNMPPSVFKKLEGLEDKPKDDLNKFETEEDFEEWYKSKMRV